MNKYLKAVSTNFIFFFLSTITFLIITPIAIHVMGEEFYGLWSTLSAVMVFSTIGTMGINSIVNKFSAEKDISGNENKIISTGWLIITPMALITLVLLLLLRDPVVSNIATSEANREQFRTAMSICTLGILPLFLSRVPQGFLLSQLQNKIVRLLDFLSSVTPLIFGVIISLFTKNLVWIAVSYTSVQLIIFVVYVFSIQKHLVGGLSFDRSIVKKMMSFSAFTFIESSAIALFQNFDRIIVTFVLGPAVSGVYSVGNSIGTRLSQVVGQVTDTMIPYASLKSTSNDHEGLYIVYRRMSRYISILVAFSAGLCIIWMNEILAVWISPDYSIRYSALFRVIILAYAILSLSRPGDQALTGLGKVKFAAITYLVASVLMLSCVYFFSKSFGVMGAGTANLVMVVLLLMNLKVYSVLKGNINFREVLQDLFWGLALPTVVYVITLLNLPAQIRGLISLLLFLILGFVTYRDNYLMDLVRVFIQRGFSRKK